MGLCQEQGANTSSHRAVDPALPGPGTSALHAAPSLTPCSLPPRCRWARSSWGSRTLGPQPSPTGCGDPSPPAWDSSLAPLQGPRRSLIWYGPEARSPARAPSPTEQPPGERPSALGSRRGAPVRRPVPVSPAGSPQAPAGFQLLPGGRREFLRRRRPPSSPPPAPSPAPARPWDPRAALGSHRPHRGCPHPRSGMGPELP